MFLDDSYIFRKQLSIIFRVMSVVSEKCKRQLDILNSTRLTFVILMELFLALIYLNKKKIYPFKQQLSKSDHSI